ncbi:chromosome segregation protein SMC [Leptolyngbya sp. NIES-2104]|uniref:chromosome segregation protein SMC n=1 Tax=Leptolyngbya sp. NIES-2104 TaxID=1552121 RepID=UPI0006EC68A4|nr:chromosome segregation protein SMC [Leptolyngbya sp. NIES-2104]GAP93950.1 chromosome partition protein smc [Leptolyngbya sp. NIES-2104]
MYVKRVELTNFKSFGGTTPIPLLPGFTVISGPNGSGKSNLLDALLFCLGLAGSKGMRAERLPDLVNHTQATKGRSTVEAAVTTVFDLTDELDLFQALMNPSEENADTSLNEPSNGNGHKHEPDTVYEVNGNGNGSTNAEWSVTRKLRVTQQGTYTSNYYINGEPCTLTELHEQLDRMRIYPEGYNVVLQGDVTRIISMNGRERREIIDELAGVASFDRKINQAKDKLDAVKDQEDKFHIVERELIEQRDRLAQDRIKAEKYKKLRSEVQSKEQWEIVLRYEQAAQGVRKLQEQIHSGEKEIADLTEQIAAIDIQIGTTTAELERLNAQVRSLGEKELLAVQSTLATREAELRQLERQQADLQKASQELIETLIKHQRDLQENQQTLAALTQEKQSIETQELIQATRERDQSRELLDRKRDEANASAENADAWVQEQSQLHHHIDTLSKSLEPQRTEQAALREKTNQLDRQILEQTDSLRTTTAQLNEKQIEESDLSERLNAATGQIQSLAASLSGVEQELQIQRQTQSRLIEEQRDKQRKLDKLEAQTQAVQEAQGTQASQVILKMGLTGVCGLVAELGQVDPRYQLALETAAGARMANIVVEDDAIAAAAIDILKQRRAGRATLLPLNKLNPPHIPNRATMRSMQGCIGYAINLVNFEDRYHDVFAYVFGTTVVFETLSDARRHLGQYRIVTLNGELLESSGAMTGGSAGHRSPLKFGTGHAAESPELAALRRRLEEIDRILGHCEGAIAKAMIAQSDRTKALTEARQQHRELELKLEQAKKELKRLESEQIQFTKTLEKNQQELSTAQSRLQILDREIPTQEAQLEQLRTNLAEIEQSQTHSEWQQIQAGIRSLESTLSEKELALRAIEQRSQDIETRYQRLQEKIEQGQIRIQEARSQQTIQLQQRSENSEQQTAVNTQITELRNQLAELDKTLGEERAKRDAVDRQLRELQNRHQQHEWQRNKTHETIQARREQLVIEQAQLAEQSAELPDPLPEAPEGITRDLGQLQHEIRSMQKRLQAMEPVNMLALEEYDRTQARLDELTEKLETLQEERTELLLRIENFTTLRQRAFMEAYEAVDINFQKIFATLSDGDGRLQLEDPNAPFNGGLNLIAHPKGKPVQRLASMSGGEKSLTALSFIFALQRYRPSPFYAFDEVDMFLDGANVERLAKMIKQQAQQAQFIVVSLRRPMIESAQRTIGVTQARGAFTQVLGIKLPQSV